MMLDGEFENEEKMFISCCVWDYFIDYNIKIYKQNGKYYASISNDGWFTQTRTLARVEGDKDTIEIVFVETLQGDSLYGDVERYDTGVILLCMKNGQSGLQTEWKELRAEHPIYADYEEEIIGSFFEKTQ